MYITQIYVSIPTKTHKELIEFLTKPSKAYKLAPQGTDNIFKIVAVDPGKNSEGEQDIVCLSNFKTSVMKEYSSMDSLGYAITSSARDLINSYAPLKGSEITVLQKRNNSPETTWQSIANAFTLHDTEPYSGTKKISIELISDYKIEVAVFKEISKTFPEAYMTIESVKLEDDLYPVEVIGFNIKNNEYSSSRIYTARDREFAYTILSSFKSKTGKIVCDKLLCRERKLSPSEKAFKMVCIYKMC